MVLLVLQRGSELMSFPFRIGTTSYIIEADLVANARFLADKVDDMQLVLFELPNGPSNIPSPQIVNQFAEIGHSSALTYSIHLIDDLPADSADHPAMQRCKRLVELFEPLQPSAFVLHLDGREIRQTGYPAQALEDWQQGTRLALEQLSDWVGDGQLLAVENLEGYPPEFVTPIVEQTTAGRCVDVGHLWLDGIDPMPHLRSALPRARIIHLHGLKDGRDHQSLAHMAADQIDPIVRLLIESNYAGIVTLEIFGRDDFESSLQAIKESMKRVTGLAP